MAVNTISYNVELDSSQIQSRAHEIRSMLSGVFSGAQGAAGGLGQFATTAAYGYGMMRGGLQAGIGAIHTATDPAIAYSPHYGMIRAQTSLGQEWAAYNSGPAGVVGQTPPGVGAGEYATALQRNFYQRGQNVATGFARGAVPVAAELAAWGVGSAVGGLVGGAAKLGTLGMAAATIGTGFVFGAAASYVATKAIERGDKKFNEINELGRLVTAGRGFSLGQSQEYGVGLRDMATRMQIAPSELGDIVSGIRRSGMMPRTRDTKAALSQFEGMAKDIRDVAVGMQTSLATATRYLKEVERLGIGRGAGGVFAAAGMAGGLGTSLGGLIAHVGMGQRVGTATGVGAGAGGQLFLQSAFAGARGLGALAGPERLMVGGAMGLGKAFGMQAMQNAMGPWGQMQMMAMMGPRGAMALPGDAMGTVGQAAQNIFGGGSPVGNMAEFLTNRLRMTRQLGGRGLRMMQAQAISSEAAMMQQMFPSIGQRRAIQLVSMNKNLNEHQARGMANYIMRGFKDLTPSGAVQAMPGAFGGPAVARMASRVAVDTNARAIAAGTSKWFGAQAIDWLGDKWADFRMGMSRAADRSLQDRTAAFGIVRPTDAAIRSVSRSMRSRGTNLSGMAPMQNMLTFAGGTTAGDVRDLANTIHSEAGGRISANDMKTVDSAAEKISGWGLRDKAAYDKAVKAVRTGSTDPSAYRTLLDAGGLGGEFRSRGFSGPNKIAMLSVLRRVTGTAVGSNIAKSFGGVGARSARVRDVRERALLARIIGDENIEKGDVRGTGDSGMARVGAFLGNFTTTVIPSLLAEIEGGAGAKLSKTQAMRYRRLMVTPQYKTLLRTLKGTNTESVKKARTAFLKKANQSGRPEIRRAGRILANSTASSKNLRKEITAMYSLTADKTRGASKKGAGPARGDEKVVAFQNQAMSFQSQVATSLRKTAHTLDQVQTAMRKLNAKIKATR